MAERELYLNDQEPEFPFELVKPSLQWLHEFLASNITITADASQLLPPSLAPLLDTLLVFTRARTSAFHGLQHYRLCQTLAARLNSALSSVGASYHRVELVRRGPGQFFITSSNSPRFCWDTHLTHRLIGQNLDYFAPGHITKEPHPPRGRIVFVEKQSVKAVMAEMVILSVLDDPRVRDEMHSFSDTKQHLFNRSMELLGLPYRFKWTFETEEVRENVVNIMKASTPPSSAWWETNCYFVNGYGFPDLLQDLSPYCSFESNYDLWWPLIQTTFTFMLKYKRTELWFSSPTIGLAYWTEMSNIFEQIRAATESILDSEQMSYLVDDFTERLKVLADEVDRSPLPESSDLLQPPSFPRSFWRTFWIKYCDFRQWFSYKFGLTREFMKIHLFERSKLRKPLIRQGIFNPPSSVPDRVPFR